MWKVQNFGTDTYNYISYKDFLTAALLTERQEETTRMRKQGESARANSANTNAPQTNTNPNSNSGGNRSRKRKARDATEKEGSQTNQQDPSQKRTRVDNRTENQSSNKNPPQKKPDVKNPCKYCKEKGLRYYKNHEERNCFKKDPSKATPRVNKDNKQDVSVCLAVDLHREQYHAYRCSPTAKEASIGLGWYVDSVASD